MSGDLTALQQYFSAPSDNDLQQSQPCGICWTDHEDRIARLSSPAARSSAKRASWPGHKAPLHPGAHPICRAKLLPPSVASRIEALKYWTADIWQQVLILAGGNTGLVIFLLLWTLTTAAKMLPESQPKIFVRLTTTKLEQLGLAYRFVAVPGWKRMLLLYCAVWTVIGFLHSWLRGRFPGVTAPDNAAVGYYHLAC